MNISKDETQVNIAEKTGENQNTLIIYILSQANECCLSVNLRPS